MPWEVEYTDTFEAWWVGLTVDTKESVAAIVGLLEHLGPHLPFPYSSDVRLARRYAIRERHLAELEAEED